MDAKQVLEMVRYRTWLFDKEVMAVIEQALECQVPKAPKRIRESYYGTIGNCPSCGKCISEKYDRRICDCGQKIDWEAK